MNWFKRHLNWTCVLGYPLGLVVFFVVGGLVGKVLSEEAAIGAGVVAGFTTKVVLDGWILRQKGRSLWWLLSLPLLGWGLPIWLENKKGNQNYRTVKAERTAERHDERYDDNSGEV